MTNRLTDYFKGANMVELCTNGAADHGTEPALRTESALRDNIRQVLREAGYRLTTTQMLAALEAAGHIHGESTVRIALAEMVREGQLDNQQRSRPKGYGLAAVGTASVSPRPVPVPAESPSPQSPAVAALLHLLDNPQPLDLSLAMGGWRLTVRLAETDLPSPAEGPPHPCIAAAIKTLREVGHRLTRAELQAEMAKRGQHFSERTLARYLPRAEGITSDPRQGSGLPEWRK